jgi:hypothetical protein
VRATTARVGSGNRGGESRREARAGATCATRGRWAGNRGWVGAGRARSAGGSDREVGDPRRRLFAVRAQDSREAGASGDSLHMALNICRDLRCRKYFF